MIYVRLRWKSTDRYILKSNFWFFSWRNFMSLMFNVLKFYTNFTFYPVSSSHCLRILATWEIIFCRVVFICNNHGEITMKVDLILTECTYLLWSHIFNLLVVSLFLCGSGGPWLLSQRLIFSKPISVSLLAYNVNGKSSDVGILHANDNHCVAFLFRIK